MARVWTSGPPDSGMEIPDRKAGTEEIRVSYAVDGHCAPRSKCVGRPAPASARGHRPHPLDVQRQAHEVPLAAHLRQASQAESSESEHLLDPPVRRLREPLALCVPGFARGARQFLTHAVNRLSILMEWTPPPPGVGNTTTLAHCDAVGRRRPLHQYSTPINISLPDSRSYTGRATKIGPCWQSAGAGVQGALSRSDKQGTHSHGEIAQARPSTLSEAVQRINHPA